MKKLHTVRILLLALLVSLVPAVSHAGVFISVGFAPPPLPVYVQPMCPQPGLMWVPGYWAYGPDGYYWVPGAWVPAPYEGALWTPGYWGWGSGFYMWHPGYWGNYVGYYGGVNYGFGYFGIGFVGGHWHDHDFEYNDAVMRIDRGRIHNYYEDRQVINRYTVVNNHISYNGGRGGINYRPSERERAAMNERHFAPTNYQTQHEMQYRNNRNAYARFNNGRPQNVVARQPLRGETRPTPNQMRVQQQPRANYQMQRPANPGFQQNRNMQQNQQRPQQYNQNQRMQQQQQQYNRQQQQRPQPYNQNQQRPQQYNQNQRMQQQPQYDRQQQMQQQRQQQQYDRQQQQRPQQQSRPQNQGRPQQESR
ncbi:MAG TPA: YXWGXW repeat-containing protein, partial [Terracidiphilus sp.]|nr:YXWGXW repeat-containing protein [Terracidiphilus sp.]